MAYGHDFGGSSGKVTLAEWLEGNFKAALAVTAILATLAVSYYALVTLPSLKREELARRESQADVREGQRQLELARCLYLAGEDYHSRWEKTCNRLSGDADCALPRETAALYDASLRQSREECFKQYPER